MVNVSVLLLVLGIIAVFLIIVIVYLARPKGKKIEQTVRDMFDKRKSIKEVLSYGRLMKWDPRKVQLYYLLFSMQSFKKRGYGIDEVKSMAEDAGWSRELVDIISGKLR